MKDFITTEWYYRMAENDIRAIDMYILEITNTLSNVLSGFQWKETNFSFKKKLKEVEVFEISKLVSKRLRDFVFKSCKTCKGRCVFEKERDAKIMFEHNFFRKGTEKEEIPERLREMRKIDFFLFEFSLTSSNCIYSYLKEKYSETLSNTLYREVLNHVVEFSKDNCLNDCHIACLEKPFNKNFHCFYCEEKGNHDLCPYDGNRREYLLRSL